MATATAEPVSTAGGATVPLAYRVVRNRRELADTRTLELEPVGAAIEPIAPGQFTMLYAFGVGEAPISTSGDTSDDGRLVHTVRAAGAVTQAICAARPGDLLGVRGPFGNTWPLEAARGHDVVLLAGGIGLAPLRPAVHRLLARRGEYGRVVLLYGGRSPGELLYRTELGRLRSRLDVSVEVTVDTAGPDWHGRVGVVTNLLRRAHFDPEDAVALVCGPEIMMWFAARSLLESGVAAERVHVSLERTMRCGIGLCGHCQLGPTLVCRDGPVYAWPEVEWLLRVPEL
jgi:NAD(P)H-flavin reductase